MGYLQANKTPMEVAQWRRNQKIIGMLTEHKQRQKQRQQQQQQQQQRQREQEERERRKCEQEQTQRHEQMKLEQRQREQEQQQRGQEERERRKREQEQQQKKKKKKSDRKTEADQRAELMQNEANKAYQEVMSKVAGKSEGEVREMMSRGEVVTNMWTAMRDQWAEAQQATLHLQQEYNSATAQLRSTREQIAALQKQEKEQEQRAKEIEQRMASNKRSQQALEAVEVLAKAERSGEERLKKQMKEGEQEDTLLGLEDIGYFLNSLGMARNSRLLFALCKDDPEMAEMSIADAGVLLAEHIPLGDRLEIQFGIEMVKHKQYPSYQKHWKECAVCKSTVSELATEYEIRLKKEGLDGEELSSFGLPFLPLSELHLVLESNTSAEKLKAIKSIKAMRENHTNHLVK